MITNNPLNSSYASAKGLTSLSINLGDTSYSPMYIHRIGGIGESILMPVCLIPPIRLCSPQPFLLGVSRGGERFFSLDNLFCAFTFIPLLTPQIPLKPCRKPYNRIFLDYQYKGGES